MALFDSLKKQLQSTVKQTINAQAQKTAQSIRSQGQKAVNGIVTGSSRSWTVTFDRLPQTLDELKALPEAALKEPHHTAALTVAALCLYPKDRDAAQEMLRFLSGPRELTPMFWQSINDRFMDGKDYIPRSFFEGATPENDYTPNQPYTLRLWFDPYGSAEEGYTGLTLQSGGADSKRQIKLRLKPSTGEWFLWQQDLLAGIRIPKSQDKWA